MGKELAVKETTQFMVLENAQDAIEAIKCNLDGENLSPQDLDKVGVPAGGGINWCIPGIDGDENTPEIVGVIVAVANIRALWQGDFSGGGEPPDCTSEDTINGVGDPGGICQLCPLAQFGSDSRGKGQKCKSVKQFFMLRPGSMLPLVVNFPPTSLKPAKHYLTRLVSVGIKRHAAVTRITLEKTKNSEGIAYSVASFALAGKLDPGQAQAMEDYAQTMGPLLRRPVGADDFSHES